MTGKERARLRGLANGMTTTVQIGKEGITPAVLQQLEETITARELIKLRVLETAGLPAKEAASRLAEELQADVIQVIGTRVVLYRCNPDKKAYVAE